MLSINGQVYEKLHLQFSHWLAASVAFIIEVAVWPPAHSKSKWVPQTNCDKMMGNIMNFFLSILYEILKTFHSLRLCCFWHDQIYLYTKLRKINGHWDNSAKSKLCGNSVQIKLHLHKVCVITFHCAICVVYFILSKLNLTRIEPAYGIFVLRFQPKKQQFSVALPTP